MNLNGRSLRASLRKLAWWASVYHIWLKKKKNYNLCSFGLIRFIYGAVQNPRDDHSNIILSETNRCCW